MKMRRGPAVFLRFVGFSMTSDEEQPASRHPVRRAISLRIRKPPSLINGIVSVHAQVIFPGWRRRPEKRPPEGGHGSGGAAWHAERRFFSVSAGADKS
jgi:hypothetical protein